MPPVQDPTPDGVVGPAQIFLGDYAGPLTQLLPTVGFTTPYRGGLTLTVLFSQPVPVSALQISLTGPEGSSVSLDPRKCVFGRYSANHDLFVLAESPPACPFNPSIHQLWCGQGLLFPTPGTPAHEKVYLSRPEPFGVRRFLFEGRTFQHQGSTYQTGPAIVYGLFLDLRAQINDLRLLSGRSAYIKIEQNGVLLAKYTVVAVPCLDNYPEAPEFLQGVSVGGTQVNLMDGDVRHQLQIFSAEGPGLPVDMTLQYYASASSYWRSVAPSSQVEGLAYAPFGHGWSGAYTMRVLKRTYELRTTSGLERFDDINFQDTNGRIVAFGPSSSAGELRPRTFNGISSAFNEPYDNLTLRTLSNGQYELQGKVSRPIATFDSEGRLIQVRRRDYPRALELQYSSGEVLIIDSSGRRTTWRLSGGLVRSVRDPANRVWQFSYVGHSLMSVVLDGSSYVHRFDYDDETYQLNRIEHPFGVQTQIRYSPPGNQNRVAAHTVHEVEEAGRRYVFDYQQTGNNPDEFRLHVTNPAGQTTEHLFRERAPLPDSSQEFPRWETIRGPTRTVKHLYPNLLQTYICVNARTHLWRYSRLGGRLIAVAYPDGTSEGFGYESEPNQHRLRVLRDRAGRLISQTFVDVDPALDLLETATYPRAHPNEEEARELHDYYPSGELQVFTDAIGVTTEFERSQEPGKVGLVTKITKTGVNGEVVVDEFEHDELGRITIHTEDEGKETHLRYNQLDQVERVLWPDGTVTTYEYEQGGLLKGITDSGGGEIQYVRNAAGFVEQEIVADAGTTLYEYDELGRVRRVTDPTGRVLEHEYDLGDQIKSIKENGTLLFSFSYDAAGNLTESVEHNTQDGTQSVTNYDYDECNRVRTATLPTFTQNGTSWRPTIEYSYAPDGQVAQIKRQTAPGIYETIEYEYDGRGRVHKVKRIFPPDEKSEENFYFDRAGNLTLYEGPEYKWLSGTTPRHAIGPNNNRQRTVDQYENDGLGRPVTLSNQAGEEMARVEYGRAGRVVALFSPGLTGMNAQELGEYDEPSGQLRALFSPDGHATRIFYDSAGRPYRAVDPYGTETTVEYDRSNRPIRVTVRGADGKEEVCESSYYETGEIRERVQVLGSERRTTTYDWTPSGELRKITNALGKETRFEYDGFGRLWKRLDANGLETTYTYNALGILVQVSYSNGHTIDRTFDAAGRLVSEENSLFRKELEHDPQGRPTTIRLLDKTNPASLRTLRLSYDFFDKLARVEDESGDATYYSYSSSGQLVEVAQGSMSVPAVRRAVYTYDPAGRIKSREIHPGLFRSDFDYDASGRLERVVNLVAGSPPNSEIEYRYDQLGRVQIARYARLGLVVAYGYDGVGRLSLEEIGHQSRGILYRAEWEYDGAGNRILSRRNGVATNYQYNAFNQLVGITQTRVEPFSGAVSALADSELDSDHSARLAVDGQTPNSSGANQAFASSNADADHWLDLELGQPAQIAGIELHLPSDHGLPGKLGIGYQSSQGGPWEPMALTFLGSAERPTQVSGTPGFAEFAPRGQIVRLAFAPVLARRVRILQGRGDAPLQAVLPYALVLSEARLFRAEMRQIDLLYDDNGNLIQEGDRRYEYDGENRLMRIREIGVIDLELLYGPDGMLLREVDNVQGVRHDFEFLGLEPYSEYAGDGSTTRRFIRGHATDFGLGWTASPPGPGATSRTYHFLWDRQGSTHQVVDDQNNVVETRLTNAWGEPLYEEVERLASSPRDYQTDFGYAGRRALGQTGLLDYRARVYDPKLGRFLTPDPAGMRDGLNRYVYAFNDPISHRDPSGFEAEESVAWAYLSGFAEGLGLGVHALANAIPKAASFGFYEGDLFGVPSDPTDRRIYDKAAIPARVSAEAGFAVATFGISAAAKTAQGATVGTRALRAAATVTVLGEGAQAARDTGQGLAEISHGNIGTGSFYVVTGLLSFGGAVRGWNELRHTDVGRYLRGWGSDVLRAMAKTPPSQGLNMMVIPNPHATLRLIRQIAQNRRLRQLVDEAHEILGEEYRRLGPRRLPRAARGRIAGAAAEERIVTRARELGFEARCGRRPEHYLQLPEEVGGRSIPDPDLADYRIGDVLLPGEKVVIELTLEEVTNLTRMSRHKQHQIPDYLMAGWQPIVINATADTRPWFGFRSWQEIDGW